MATLEIEGWPVLSVASGTTLLEACEAHSIPMESECGGFAGCNSCRVRVIAGADALSPLGDEEIPFLDDEDQRLGCQAEICGQVRVRLEPGM